MDSGDAFSRFLLARYSGLLRREVCLHLAGDRESSGHWRHLGLGLLPADAARAHHRRSLQRTLCLVARWRKSRRFIMTSKEGSEPAPNRADGDAKTEDISTFEQTDASPRAITWAAVGLLILLVLASLIVMGTRQ